MKATRPDSVESVEDDRECDDPLEDGSDWGGNVPSADHLDESGEVEGHQSEADTADQQSTGHHASEGRRIRLII